MPDNSETEITFKFDKPEKLGYLVIKENICMSQRVENFTVSVSENGSFRKVYDGTVIGYKRIVPLNDIVTDCIKITITDSRLSPIISFIGIKYISSWSDAINK